ncbi:hypothetical protein [Geotalea toluenoxydans]|uniref:hypothetical protein n=1 Tax=Geotalea toluenoxydans TaxID=421624 RepID=UPI0006CFB80A|nr:hypothetical protein [Geotalea toluenoxydans]
MSLTINDKGTSGSGGAASYIWDGKTGINPVPAGVYQGKLTATADICTAETFANAKVVEPPNQCPVNVNFGSTANVTTGNLSFNQDLFSTRGGTLPLAFSLNYNSLDTTTGSISRAGGIATI